MGVGQAWSNQDGGRAANFSTSCCSCACKKYLHVNCLTPCLKTLHMQILAFVQMLKEQINLFPLTSLSSCPVQLAILMRWNAKHNFGCLQNVSTIKFIQGTLQPWCCKSTSNTIMDFMGSCELGWIQEECSLPYNPLQINQNKCSIKFRHSVPITTLENSEVIFFTTTFHSSATFSLMFT